jgi:putative phosphoribosyl transferase
MPRVQFLARNSERFRDRRDAGRRLARLVEERVPHEAVVVLALPRGGVPVGYEIARTLHATLDAFAVRKLGVPGHRELAMGAVASGGVTYLNEEVVAALHISREELIDVAREELAEMQRRDRIYRDHRPQQEVAGRTAILVDDGLATGSSMLVAIAALRKKQPARIVVAVPVASLEAFEAVGREADDAICSRVPEQFFGVGFWYDDFSQVGDDEVRELLDAAARGGEP